MICAQTCMSVGRHSTQRTAMPGVVVLQRLHGPLGLNGVGPQVVCGAAVSEEPATWHAALDDLDPHRCLERKSKRPASMGKTVQGGVYC